MVSTHLPEFVMEMETIRILHVDEEPDFADLAASMLERGDHRFEVETTTSPADARDQLVVSDFEIERPLVNFLEHGSRPIGEC